MPERNQRNQRNQRTRTPIRYSESEFSDFDTDSEYNYGKGYIYSLIDSLNTQIRENQSKIFGAVEPIFEYASKMLILEMNPYVDMVKKAYFLVMFMFVIILGLVLYLLFEIRGVQARYGHILPA